MSVDPLLAYGWQGVLLAAWVGLAVGSFLNVVIHRLPRMLERDWQAQAREILELAPAPPGERYNLSVPRSRCPHCERAIRWYENIPILSWLWLRARCAGCAAPISWRYPAVEALTAAATLAVLAVYGFTPIGAAAVVFTWLLIALTCIDFDTQYLPDPLVYAALWLGLAANALLPGIVLLTDAVIGAIAGYLFLWTTFWGFKLATGKEGMGYGDFKLLAALGAWLGWQALPGIMLLSATLGLGYALARIALRRQARQDPIPFGPFLAGAGFIALVARARVLDVFMLG